MTRLLLDSHAMLWFSWDDPRLSGTAKALIEDAGNRKLVSIASCWEIAIKVGLGKLDLGEPSQSFLSREIASNNFELLPITLAHATMVEQLAVHHRDPFDRLLAVQAIADQHGNPVQVEDPVSHARYVLLQLDVYQQLQVAMNYDASEPNPRDFYPAFADAVRGELDAPGIEPYDEGAPSDQP
jgi:PIN domain nuclease of toxin-antitoxin system